MRRLATYSAGLLVGLLLLCAAVASADDTADPDAKPFSDDQIEQRVAPIALYPDALVADAIAEGYQVGDRDQAAVAIDAFAIGEGWSPVVD